MTINSSRTALVAALEQQKSRLRQAHPDWTEERVKLEFSRSTQDLFSYLVDNLVNDEETPRSFQQGPPNPMLATDLSWFSTDPSFANLDTHGQPLPIPMSRASLSTPSYLAGSSQHSFGGNSTGSKRDYGQVDMDYSSSYVLGMEPYHPTDQSLTSSMMDPLSQELTMYQPDEYVNMCREAELSVKKQKLDIVSDVSSCSLPSSYNVTPTSSMSMTLISPGAQSLSESMSRQSSTTSSGLIKGVGMLRLDSFSSITSDLQPVAEDLENSFLSSYTERAPDGQYHDFSFSDNSFNFDYSPFAVEQQQQQQQQQQYNVGIDNVTQSMAGTVDLTETSAERMQRSDSGQSTSSTSSNFSTSSTKQKIAERQRKHVENAKQQPIAMKGAPSGGGPKSGQSSSSSPSIKSPSSSTQRKAKHSIPPKTHYQRPKHPKVFCDKCNEYPDGFKGEHELRRHSIRAHQLRRKVWIIQKPPQPTDLWPESPIDICKSCKAGKQYPVDYNAAAHLRRIHFVPCKRGRKPRGDPREEQRAGKAGGDWPKIDVLKQEGWLKEIEVVDGVGGEEEEEEEELEADETLTRQGLQLSCEVLGMGHAFMPPGGDFAFFGGEEWFDNGGEGEMEEDEGEDNPIVAAITTATTTMMMTKKNAGVSTGVAAAAATAKAKTGVYSRAPRMEHTKSVPANLKL